MCQNFFKINSTWKWCWNSGLFTWLDSTQILCWTLSKDWIICWLKMYIIWEPKNEKIQSKKFFKLSQLFNKILISLEINFFVVESTQYFFRELYKQILSWHFHTIWYCLHEFIFIFILHYKWNFVTNLVWNSTKNTIHFTQNNFSTPTQILVLKIDTKSR